MGNQAATLASRERRRITRAVREIAEKSTMLIQDLNKMLPDGDLEPARIAGIVDQLVDLETFARNALTYADRWGAFLEVADGN